MTTEDFICVQGDTIVPTGATAVWREDYGKYCVGVGGTAIFVGERPLFLTKEQIDTNPCWEAQKKNEAATWLPIGNLLENAVCGMALEWDAKNMLVRLRRNEPVSTKE